MCAPLLRYHLISVPCLFVNLNETSNFTQTFSFHHHFFTLIQLLHATAVTTWVADRDPGVSVESGPGFKMRVDMEPGVSVEASAGF